MTNQDRLKLSAMRKKIYNVPASCGFTDVLAQKFLDEYRENRQALADVLFLLPNRRAVKALADAFVRAEGLSPMLLPRMMPLGEAEEDELFLTGGGSKEYLSGMFPAISGTERSLLFTKIIMSKPGDFRHGKNVVESGLFSGTGIVRTD